MATSKPPTTICKQMFLTCAEGIVDVAGVFVAEGKMKDTAVPTLGFEIPPYHVETFPIGSCVCNKHGFNCLSFTDKPGAKFTTLERATAICERWNTSPNAELNGGASRPT